VVGVGSLAERVPRLHALSLGVAHVVDGIGVDAGRAEEERAAARAAQAVRVGVQLRLGYVS
jgi:hypothetical protein